MMVKEVIPLGEIGFNYEFRGEIGISFVDHLEETVKGILLTDNQESSLGIER